MHDADAVVASTSRGRLCMMPMQSSRRSVPYGNREQVACRDVIIGDDRADAVVASIQGGAVRQPTLQFGDGRARCRCAKPSRRSGVAPYGSRCHRFVAHIGWVGKYEVCQEQLS